MYLLDLLFTLPSGIDVRIKFDGNPDVFCLRTGRRNTGESAARLTREGHCESVVHDVIPLWSTRELLIKCN